MLHATRGSNPRLPILLFEMVAGSCVDDKRVRTTAGVVQALTCERTIESPPLRWITVAGCGDRHALVAGNRCSGLGRGSGDLVHLFDVGTTAGSFIGTSDQLLPGRLDMAAVAITNETATNAPSA